MQDMNLSKARILVADDDVGQRAFFGDLLEDLGNITLHLDSETRRTPTRPRCIKG